MKHLRFHEVLLLSKSERRARRLSFHPQANVVRGPNGTGKSSLLKSLYWTLGAEPSNIHPRWREANVIASLRITVDDVRFRIVRFGGRFCVFDANDNLQAAFSNVTTGLSPYFAELFDFQLFLSTRSEDAQATPAFLFLPFYLDQDNGWTSPHDSFDRLGQFVSPRKDTLEFHTGIRPSEYYKAKAVQKKAELDSQPLRAERLTLQRVLDDLEIRLAAGTFDIDLTAYEAEISRLLVRCNQLRQIEEGRKRKMADAYVIKRSVDEQRLAVESALAELRADREFAATLQDPVICPTCHALYTNGFGERFDIALDEDTCITLLAELKEQEESANEKWEETRQEVDEAREATQEIEEILSVKKGEVALADVLRKEGQKDVSRALIEQIAVLDTQIGKFDGVETGALAQMKEFDDRKRKQEILAGYRSEMARLLMNLDVHNMSEASYRDLNCTVKESGSNLPRAVLAYFFALLHTIHSRSTSTFCPLVIDSPHQQDQDPENWTRILTCIQTERPEDGQLFLATTTDTGFDFGGSVLDLSTKNYLLAEDEFDDVNSELTPLIDKGLA